MRFSPSLTSHSTLDTVFRSIKLSQFFTKGWGDPSLLKDIFKFRKIISNRDKCQTLIDPKQSVYIDKCLEKNSDYSLYEGHFKSPLVDYLPVDGNNRIARFQLIKPSKDKLAKANLDPNLNPAVVHLAGTGDHGFWKRRNFMCKPLLDYGISSLIIENPFYGSRKPKEQHGSCLLNVQDLFIMGGCLILECLVLFNYLERSGYGPLGVTGISLGGHMSSLAGASFPKPISIIPCLSWTTASCVFTQGVLSGAIPWNLLVEQYKCFGEETINEFEKLIHSPERNDIFDAGRQFAKQYPIRKNINDLNSDKDLLLESEHYLEKLSSLNKEKLLGNLNFDSSYDVDIISKDKIIENTNKKSDRNSLLNFINTISFNVYDSLNKTLINSKKNIQEHKDDNSLKDAINFMCGIMDETTHLQNFSVPFDPELAIILNANHDGYVPKSNLIPLNELWKGSTLRTIDTGHVLAIVFYHKLFQSAIVDSLDLNARKYHNSKIVEKSFLEREKERKNLIAKKN